ncbi:hypothetical protein HDU78_009757, partial [Chytriomyces hyalinus]
MEEGELVESDDQTKRLSAGRVRPGGKKNKEKKAVAATHGVPATQYLPQGMGQQYFHPNSMGGGFNMGSLESLPSINMSNMSHLHPISPFNPMLAYNQFQFNPMQFPHFSMPQFVPPVPLESVSAPEVPSTPTETYARPASSSLMDDPGFASWIANHHIQLPPSLAPSSQAIPSAPGTSNVQTTTAYAPESISKIQKENPVPKIIKPVIHNVKHLVNLSKAQRKRQRKLLLKKQADLMLQSTNQSHTESANPESRRNSISSVPETAPVAHPKQLLNLSIPKVGMNRRTSTDMSAKERAGLMKAYGVTPTSTSPSAVPSRKNSLEPAPVTSTPSTAPDSSVLDRLRSMLRASQRSTTSKPSSSATNPVAENSTSAWNESNTQVRLPAISQCVPNSDSRNAKNDGNSSSCDGESECSSLSGVKSPSPANRAVSKVEEVASSDMEISDNDDSEFESGSQDGDEDEGQGLVTKGVKRAAELAKNWRSKITPFNSDKTFASPLRRIVSNGTGASSVSQSEPNLSNASPSRTIVKNAVNAANSAESLYQTLTAAPETMQELEATEDDTAIQQQVDMEVLRTQMLLEKLRRDAQKQQQPTPSSARGSTLLQMMHRSATIPSYPVRTPVPINNNYMNNRITAAEMNMRSNHAYTTGNSWYSQNHAQAQAAQLTPFIPEKNYDNFVIYLSDDEDESSDDGNDGSNGKAKTLTPAPAPTVAAVVSNGANNVSALEDQIRAIKEQINAKMAAKLKLKLQKTIRSSSSLSGADGETFGSNESLMSGATVLNDAGDVPAVSDDIVIQINSGAATPQPASDLNAVDVSTSNSPAATLTKDKSTATFWDMQSSAESSPQLLSPNPAVKQAIISNQKAKSTPNSPLAQIISKSAASIKLPTPSKFSNAISSPAKNFATNLLSKKTTLESQITADEKLLESALKDISNKTASMASLTESFEAQEARASLDLERKIEEQERVLSKLRADLEAAREQEKMKSSEIEKLKRSVLVKGAVAEQMRGALNVKRMELLEVSRLLKQQQQEEAKKRREDAPHPNGVSKKAKMEEDAPRVDEDGFIQFDQVLSDHGDAADKIVKYVRLNGATSDLVDAECVVDRERRFRAIAWQDDDTTERLYIVGGSLARLADLCGLQDLNRYHSQDYNRTAVVSEATGISATASAAAYTPFDSPLTQFRSHRYFTERKSAKSLGIGNKIDPFKAMCSNELQLGQCDNRECTFQHFKDVSLSENELILDLLSHLEGDSSIDSQKLRALIQTQRGKGKSYDELVQLIIEYRKAHGGNQSHSIVFKSGKAAGAVSEEAGHPADSRVFRNGPPTTPHWKKNEDFPPQMLPKNQSILLQGLQRILDGEKPKSGRYYEAPLTPDEYKAMIELDPSNVALRI